jgi:hypothetical protein
VNDAEPLPRLRGIGKSFGPVHAPTDMTTGTAPSGRLAVPQSTEG